MINQKKFSDADGKIDFDRLEEWCENYFQSVMGMFNALLGNRSPEDVMERLKAITFEDLVREQLETELEEVRDYAVKVVSDLHRAEIEYYQAYLEDMTV